MISFGIDQAALYRLAASYVDRILKGEKPADLPARAVYRGAGRRHLVELRKQRREERNAAIAPLKAEIADLKGKLDSVANVRFAPRATDVLRCREASLCAMSRRERMQQTNARLCG